MADQTADRDADVDANAELHRPVALLEQRGAAVAGFQRGVRDLHCRHLAGLRPRQAGGGDHLIPQQP
jgi:hypothetical protein